VTGRPARSVIAPILLAALTFALSGCGGRTAAAPARVAARIKSISTTQLPEQVGGLDVQAESVPQSIKANTSSYARSIGFFSLRKAKLVEATLEVIRLTPNANSASSGFQTSLIGQVSGSLPEALTLSGHTVYQSTGTGATLEVWFSGSELFILTIRSSFPTPRSLTESALALGPQ